MVIMIYNGWAVHESLWYILCGWFMVIMVYIGWVVHGNYGIYWVGGSW